MIEQPYGIRCAGAVAVFFRRNFSEGGGPANVAVRRLCARKYLEIDLWIIPRALHLRHSPL
jgi:hypothetical protein